MQNEKRAKPDMRYMLTPQGARNTNANAKTHERKKFDFLPRKSKLPVMIASTGGWWTRGGGEEVKRMGSRVDVFSRPYKKGRGGEEGEQNGK